MTGIGDKLGERRVHARNAHGDLAIMNIYQQFHHRQQQRETRSLATNAAELNHRPLPQTATAVGPSRPGHLDPDRVLPPLATSSEGSKFVPFWKRTQQQQPPAHHPAPSQQVVQQQPATVPPPKKKWLTQAEMGMVSPAVIPLPIPTARTSTTSTTTTTTNTSTTTNNNVGTTVSSSGSGITASSVTGRTFNYNYNNYNHHVHQFNQPPSGPNSRHSIGNQPGAGPPNNPALVDQARKHMSWHGRAPAAYAGHPVQHQVQEDEETSEEEEATEEEDDSSSVPPSPQYGILDLPVAARGHRRAQSHPHTTLSAIRDVGTHKQKKRVHLDPGLPKPPPVLVLQTPSHRNGDYTPAYAYEYSLKYDRDIDGRNTRVERKKGRRGHLREEESEEEDESEENEESEDLPPPKKKRTKMKNGEKKSVKTKASKSKAKVKGKPKEKQKKLKSRGSRDVEDESEEDETNEEGEKDEDEDEDSSSDHEVRKKPKRAIEAPKPKKKASDMSLQLASMNIKDNQQTSQLLLHHRQSRSEDYTWQSQSTMSRNASGGYSNGWPAGLPRLPRTPGTPADGMPPGPSFAPGSASPLKRETGYFDYQPNQPTHAQPYSHPQPGTRPSTRSSQGLYTPMTRTSNLSSTPVSTTSNNSTLATSYASSVPGQPRSLGKEQGYMNLDDPPPASLRRSPSPGYSSSSRSHSYTRSLPQANINPPLNYGPSSSSSPSTAYEQIRSRVEQSQVQQVQSQPASQPQSRMHALLPQPQPPEPVRRYTQPLSGAPNFRSSQAFWQEQAQVQQQQQQQSPYHPPPSQHRPLPSSSSGGGSLITNGYGTADGYRNVQVPVSSAPAPAHVPSAPTRRRDLPPQPAQGRERAQEILKEAMERQALRAQPAQHQPPPQLQQQQHQPQWRPQPAQPPSAPFAPHIQQAQQGLQQQPCRPPLPQPSLSQQQYRPQPGPSPQQHPLQHSQPPVSNIQQYRQPIIQHLPHTQQPQQHPSQHQPNHVSQPLPPQPPPARPRQQPLPPQPQPRPQPQPPQIQPQQPQRQPIEARQPPQAQRNVYRPSTLPVESPLPVGGRDKVADIPRMGKAASVVGSVSSGYASGGNLSASGSDADSSRGPSSDVGPQIVVNVVGDDQGHRDRMGGKSPSVHDASQVSSPQMPVIHVQGEGEGPPGVPEVQVFGVPDINIDGPGDVGAGDLPSISISGETFNNTSRSRPQSQPKPEIRPPQQRAKSVPAFADRTHGANVVQTRPQPSGLSCGGCRGSIIGRVVSAMDAHWHPECFRCSVCDTLLEHVSSYEHEGKPYCHLDYHENFAPRCYHCKTAIVEERFISLDDPALGKRTYHEQHFFCAECGDPFLTPSSENLEGDEKRSGELALSGDGEFESDNVGFTVFRGHPYCESCHVRLRFPKCKRCKKSIKDGDRAVEALGGKWCWACFLCESCQKPFEDPAFFQRGEKPYCEPCFSVMLRNEV